MNPQAAEDVKWAVEAALLNSECSPREAVLAALRVVVAFAEAEANMTPADVCAEIMP